MGEIVFVCFLFLSIFKILPQGCVSIGLRKRKGGLGRGREGKGEKCQ